LSGADSVADGRKRWSLARGATLTEFSKSDGGINMTKQLDGVFEGGGVRGIGLVGALSVIEEAGYEFVNLAGTSAGAIVSTLIAAGYKAAEIRAIIDGIDFKRMTDDAGFGRVPFVAKWIHPPLP